MRFHFIPLIFLLFFLSGCRKQSNDPSSVQPSSPTEEELRRFLVEDIRLNHPLSIERLKRSDYPGSIPVVESNLKKGNGYTRSIVSYLSEGLKQRGLLTIPDGKQPDGGWPVIIFNHGFIPPEIYRTTERYAAYQDAFARSGFITFKPDYRGHDKSEGEANGAYGDPGFTVDVMNAAASIRQMPEADASRTGLWGHSMGGFISLQGLVIKPDWFKAAVIWGGVVASPEDRQRLWWSRRERRHEEGVPESYHRHSQSNTESLGDMAENRDLWNLVSANSYIKDIMAPVQLHHSDTDETVPVELSRVFYKELTDAGKTAELYIYEGDNHNISKNLNTALKRSVDFFKKYL